MVILYSQRQIVGNAPTLVLRTYAVKSQEELSVLSDFFFVVTLTSTKRIMR
jgi:hypothetical protein